jgi:hypothetical protein
LCPSLVYAEGELTGKWYGQRIENDNLLHWLIDRNTDGTYKLFFRECYAGTPVMEHFEAGTWSLNNGIYKTITLFIIEDGIPYPLDTEDKIYIEEYAVDSLTDNIFIYTHIHKNRQFKTHRMPDDFLLECISAI